MPTAPSLLKDKEILRELGANYLDKNYKDLVNEHVFMAFYKPNINQNINIFIYKINNAKARHGFVPTKSCLSNLLETLDYIMSSLVKGHCEDRKQIVTIGEASSKWSDALSGVPQGSV